MFPISTGFMLVSKSPLAPLSLYIAYEVTEHPPLLSGWLHLRLTVVEVDSTRVGALTPIGATQLFKVTGSLRSDSPL